jgi:hypothetical protein
MVALALGCAEKDEARGDEGGAADDTATIVGTDYDHDGDGHAAIEHGGDDCNDNHPQIHPGLPDQCDGTDADCDGAVDEDFAVTVDIRLGGTGYASVEEAVAASAPGQQLQICSGEWVVPRSTCPACTSVASPASSCAPPTRRPRS